MERIYLCWLRQDDDRHGSRVDPLHPGREAHLGDPLNPVGSAFILKMSVDIFPGDSSCCVMQTTWDQTPHKLTNIFNFDKLNVMKEQGYTNKYQPYSAFV